MKTRKMALALSIALYAQAQLPSFDSPTCRDPVFEFQFDDTPVLGTGMVLYAEVDGNTGTDTLLQQQDVEGDVNEFFDSSGVAGRWVTYHPAAIDGPKVTLRPRNGLFEYGKTYRVTVPATAFTGMVGGAAFTGHSFTFTTGGAPAWSGRTLTVGIDALKFNRGTSSDFCTVQGALNEAAQVSNERDPHTVFVRSGIYREHLFLAHAEYVIIRGEDPDTTIVFPDNHLDNLDHAWNRTTLLAVDCEALTIDGVTLQSVGYHDQSSEALYFRSTTKAHHLRLQYSNIVAGIHAMHVEGFAWVFKTKVSGYTNIVTANAGLVFEDCEFRTLSPQQELGVPVVVARGGSGLGQGLVFLQCSMTADENVAAGSVYFGGSVEPLQWDESCDDMLAAVRCTFGEHVSESLWLGEPTLSPSNESQGWREYQSYGPPGALANLTLRNPLGYNLSEAEAVFVNSREALFSRAPLGVPETYSPFRHGSDAFGTVSWPRRSTENLCVDPVLTIEFDDTTANGSPPEVGSSGRIRFYDVNRTMIAVIDLSQPGTNLLGPASGGWVREVVDEAVSFDGTTAVIRPRSATFLAGERYAVEIDAFVFPNALTRGALNKFAGVTRSEDWSFMTGAMNVRGNVVTVGPRGAAAAKGPVLAPMFCTIQGAFNFVMDSHFDPGSRATVLIRDGTYREKLFLRKSNVTVRAENIGMASIEAANGEPVNPGVGMSIKRTESTGVPGEQTGGRGVFLAEDCENLIIDGVKVENTYRQDPAAAAMHPTEAVTIKASMNQTVTVRNSEIIGWGGALRLEGLAWIYNSVVTGFTDLISGVVVTALVEKSELRSVMLDAIKGGSVTRAGSSSSHDVGLVVLNSNLSWYLDGVNTNEVGGSVYLGRSLNNSMLFDNVAFINCVMDVHIAGQGWNTSIAPNPPAPEVSKGWREYGSLSGDGEIDLSSRSHALVLTEEEAKSFSTRAYVFNTTAWQPHHMVSRYSVHPAPGSTVCTDPLLSIAFEHPVSLQDPVANSAVTISEIDGRQVDSFSMDELVFSGGFIDELGPRNSSVVRRVKTDSIWVGRDNKTVYIRPRSDVLDFDREYYVEVSPGAFHEEPWDAVPVPFVGIRKQSEVWSFKTASRVPRGEQPVGVDLTVDPTGALGGYCTVQGALNRAMSIDRDTPVSIVLSAGEYHEVLYLGFKNNVVIRGLEGAIVSAANWESRNPGAGASETEGSMAQTGGRSVFFVEDCDNLNLITFSIKNSYLKWQEGEFAEAIYFKSSTEQHRLVAQSMQFHSEQGTVGLEGFSWFIESVIAGNVDFVWGPAVSALFEDCEIRSVGDSRSAFEQPRIESPGYIALALTARAEDKGIVFLNSTLTLGSAPHPNATDVALGSVYLARSESGSFGNVAYISCTLDEHVNPKGWPQEVGDPVLRSGEVLEETPGWNEFGSKNATTGQAVDTTQRPASVRVLSSTQAMDNFGNTTVVFSAFNGTSTDSGWEPVRTILHPPAVLAARARPVPGSVAVCADAVLSITFDAPPTIGTRGQIRVLNATGSVVETLPVNTTLVDELGIIGRPMRKVNYYPVWVEGSTVYMKLRQRKLAYVARYYVEIDAVAFPDALLNGTAFQGVRNGWWFETAEKPVVEVLKAYTVSKDGRSPFCTVQGALNSLMDGYIHGRDVYFMILEGVYTEMLFADYKVQQVIFRGQGPERTIIQAYNHEGLNPGEGVLTENDTVAGGRSVFLANMAGFDGIDLTIRNTHVRKSAGDLSDVITSTSLPVGFFNAVLSGTSTVLRIQGGWHHKNYCQFSIRKSRIIGGDEMIVMRSVQDAWLDAYVDECTVITLPSPTGGTQVIATSQMGTDYTDRNRFQGLLIMNTNLVAADGVENGTVFLSRSGGSDSKDDIAFVNCKLGRHIAAEGWATARVAGYAAPNPAAGSLLSGMREYGSVSEDGTPIDLTVARDVGPVYLLNDSEFSDRYSSMAAAYTPDGRMFLPRQESYKRYAGLRTWFYPRTQFYDACKDFRIEIHFDHRGVDYSKLVEFGDRGAVRLYDEDSNVVWELDFAELPTTRILGSDNDTYYREIEQGRVGATADSVLIDVPSRYVEWGATYTVEIDFEILKHPTPPLLGTWGLHEYFLGISQTDAFVISVGPRPTNHLFVDLWRDMFCTLQGALDYAMEAYEKDEPVVIEVHPYLRNAHFPLWLYDKNNVRIVGKPNFWDPVVPPFVAAVNESTARTVSNDPNASLDAEVRGNHPVFMVVDCDMFELDGVTIAHYPSGSPSTARTALAFLSTTGSHRLRVDEVRFEGGTNTLVLEGYSYITNSFVSGTRTLVAGSPKTSLFKDGELWMVADPDETSIPVVSQARCRDEHDVGFVFHNMIVSGESLDNHTTSFYLSKASANGSDTYDNIVFLNCTLDAELANPEGWAGSNVFPQAKPNPAIATINKGWREFGSRSPGGSPIPFEPRPVPEVYNMTAEEAEEFFPSPPSIFTDYDNGNGWDVDDSTAPSPVRPIPTTILYPAPGTTLPCLDPVLTITFDTNTVPRLNYHGSVFIIDTAEGRVVDRIFAAPRREHLGSISMERARTVNHKRLVLKENVLEIRVSRQALEPNSTYLIQTSRGLIDNAFVNGITFDHVQEAHEWMFFTGPGVDGLKKTLLVAKDGTGDYCSVQGALNHIMAGFAQSNASAEVRVAPGMYEELLFLDEVGEVSLVPHVLGSEVRIHYDNHDLLNAGAGGIRMNRSEVVSGGRAVLAVGEVGLFTMSGITVENTHARERPDDPSEVVAVIGSGSRFAFSDGTLLGHQSVVRCDGYCYILETLIRGSQDLLTGSPRAMMTEACELHVIKDAFQTQPPMGRPFVVPVALAFSMVDSIDDLGFVVFNTKITAADDVETATVYFGRSAGSSMYYDNVAFVACSMDHRVSQYVWAGAGESWPAPNPVHGGVQSEVMRVHTGWRETGTHDLSTAPRALARNASEVLVLTPALFSNSRLVSRALVFASYNSHTGWDPLTGGPTPKTPVPTVELKFESGPTLSLSAYAVVAFFVSTVLFLS